MLCVKLFLNETTPACYIHIDPQLARKVDPHTEHVLDTVSIYLGITGITVLSCLHTKPSEWRRLPSPPHRKNAPDEAASPAEAEKGGALEIVGEAVVGACFVLGSANAAIHHLR